MRLMFTGRAAEHWGRGSVPRSWSTWVAHPGELAGAFVVLLGSVILAEHGTFDPDPDSECLDCR